MKYPDIDPIALSIFGQINIHWYALTYLAAFFLCWRIMKATRGTGDRAWSDQQISDLVICWHGGRHFGWAHRLCPVLRI